MTETAVRGGRTKKPDWRGVVGSRAFMAVALVNFSVFFTRSSSNNTLMPLKGVSVFGLSLSEMGLVLTVMAVVNLSLLPFAATISDRHGRIRTITPSLLGVAAALSVIAIAADVPWFLVGAGILALSTAISGPAPAAFAADQAPEQMRGLSLGMFRTAGDIGLLLGPPLLGWIADVGGYGAAFGVNAAVTALAAVIFYANSRKKASLDGIAT